MKAFFQIIRAPILFSSATNVVSGFILMTFVDNGFSRPQWDKLLVLIVLSVLLYSSGAIFNDCVDADRDSRVRPERPIPSGAISLEVAYALGLSFMLVAVLLAMFLGMATAQLAALLVASIWLYNGVTKRQMILGALTMGLCRGLNMMLGMSAGSSFTSLTSNSELIWAPVLLGSYTVILSLVAHYEDRPAGGAGRWVLFSAPVGMSVVMVAAASIVVKQWPGRILLVPLSLFLGGVFVSALVRMTFESVRRATGLSIMLIVAFDAAIILGTRDAPLWLGLLVLGTLIPAILLSRVLSPS